MLRIVTSRMIESGEAIPVGGDFEFQGGSQCCLSVTSDASRCEADKGRRLTRARTAGEIMTLFSMATVGCERHFEIPGCGQRLPAIDPSMLNHGRQALSCSTAIRRAFDRAIALDDSLVSNIDTFHVVPSDSEPEVGVYKLQRNYQCPATRGAGSPGQSNVS
jgi:hypothetical protein